MNKKLGLLGAGVISLLSASALATSITTSTTKCNDFSGFYLGTQLGYGAINNNGKDEDIKGNTLGGAGFVGGFHVGFGKQFVNRFYMGLEAYGNLMDQEQTFKIKGDDGSVGAKQKKQYSLGLKLRPGLSIGNAMVYGILGLDYSRFKQSSDVVVPVMGVQAKKSRNKGYFGFMPGIGIAFNATDHIIIGLELTHTFHEKIKTSSDRTTDGFARVSYKF